MPFSRGCPQNPLKHLEYVPTYTFPQAKPKNKAHADPDKISHHVHRIGHHFPLEIIELACKKFGYKFDEQRGLQKCRTSPTYGEAYFERGLAEYQQRQRLDGKPAVETETKDHIRGAIREMFPKIPEDDLTDIVNHAFEEGTNRVGNAKELSLARRVQLAVVAHIRHEYTDYDDILRTGSWAEARQKVEHVSLAKLKEWRDESGEASNELEETFREVIVLDDEEEPSSDEESLPGAEREPSMEIFHSRATARDLQPEPIDHHPRGYVPLVSKASRRTIFLQPVHSLPRSYIPGASVTHTAPQTSRIDPRAVPLTSTPEPLRLRPESYPGRRMESRAREPVVREAYPLQIRGSDGHLYNLEPINEFRRDDRSRPIDSPSKTAYHPRPQEREASELRLYQPRPSRPDAYPDDRRQPSSITRYAREEYEPALPRVSSAQSISASKPVLAPSRRASEQDVVLPSIEREPDSVSSPRRAPDTPFQFRHDQGSASVGYVDVQSPKRKAFATSVHHPPERNLEPPFKRSRPVYDDEALVRLRPTQADVPPAYNYQPVDSSNRPRVLPDRELVELTTSLRRMPNDRDRQVNEPLRPYPIAGPSYHSYGPVPFREGDVRVRYNEAPLKGSPRAYNPAYDRVYNKQSNPSLDRAVLREEPVRFQSEGSRYYGRH